MILNAINEENTEKSTKDKNICYIKELRTKFENIVQNFENNRAEVLYPELKKFCEQIDYIIVKIENTHKSEVKVLLRLKLGCIRYLIRICKLQEKVDLIFQALDIEENDMALWIDLGLEFYKCYDLLSSLNAFYRVYEIYYSHTLIIKYICMINTVIFNFQEAVKIAEDSLKFVFNRQFQTNIFYFIYSKCIISQVKEKIRNICSKNLINLNNVNKQHADLIWLLNEYDKQNNYAYKTKIEKIPVISQDNIDFSNINTIFDSFFQVISNNFEDETFSCEVIAILNESDISSDISYIKRPNRMIAKEGSEDLENLFARLISKIIDLSVEKSSNSDQQNSSIVEIESTDFVNRLKILFTTHNLWNLTLFLVEFLKVIINSFPISIWDINLSIRFSYIFISVCERYCINPELVDEATIEIYLRFAEVYYLLYSKNLSIFNNLKIIRAKNKAMSIINDFFNISICSNSLSDFLVRLCYILSFNYTTNISIAYLQVCLDFRQNPLMLFSEKLLTQFPKIYISSESIKNLISFYENTSVLKTCREFYEKNMYDECLEYLQNNTNALFSLKSSSQIEETVNFLSIIIYSHSFIFSDSCYMDFIIEILDILTSFKYRDAFMKEFFTERGESVFDNIFLKMYNLTESQLKSLLVIVSTLLSSLDSSNYLYAKFWYYIFEIIFRLLKYQNEKFILDFLWELSDLFCFDIVRSHICCSEKIKPIMYLILKELQKLSGIEVSSDSDYTNYWELYLEAIFSCLVGYPSVKKIAAHINYYKDHSQNIDKKMTLTNIMYFTFAYSYFKPSHKLNFSFIPESIKSNNKKSIMSSDLIKFLEFMGNGFSEIVYDDTKNSLSYLCNNFEKYLHGDKKWPGYLFNDDYNYKINFSHALDFSIFHYLAEYNIKIQTPLISLKWVLLSIMTMPCDYLTWWACSSYLIFKCSEELLAMKYFENDGYISEKFNRLLNSLFLCYNRICFYQESIKEENKWHILIDLGWFYHNISTFFKINCTYSIRNQEISNKISKMSANIFKFLFENLSPLTNEYLITIKYHYLSLKNLENELNPERILYQGIEAFKTINSADKNFIIFPIVYIFEISLILWNSNDSSNSEILAKKLVEYSCLIDRNSKYETTVSDFEILNQNTNQDSLTPVGIEEVENTTQEDLGTKDKLEFPKDDLIFAPKIFRISSLFCMFNCLNYYPNYIKYIIEITVCLLELSRDQPYSFKRSFNRMIIYFLSGNISPIIKSNSSIFNKMFSTLKKKSCLSNSNFVGVFSLNYRTSIFRKCWIVNSRFMDDLILFQLYISKGISILVDILITLEDTCFLLHVASCLIKERNNDFIFEEDRIKLIKKIVDNILDQIDIMCKEENNMSLNKIDKIIFIVQKASNLPFRLLKTSKDNLLQKLIKFYSLTDNYKSSQRIQVDSKQILEAATKYASTLKNRFT